ncbi:DEAD/DEAH box helicase, partial [Desulfobulbus sp. TB]|nr:DEAD/DEAH box helicase [Desulfobulbus sp. TB]
MIKRFLIKAGRKLKRLTTSDGNRKKAVSCSARSEQQQQQENRQRADQNRPVRRPRKKKPRWTVEQFPVDPVEGKSRLHDFSLPLGIMHALADLDFKYCSTIQEKALPDAMAGKDIIARAGTGTGKSAVFLIAVFTRLLNENRQQQA